MVGTRRSKEESAGKKRKAVDEPQPNPPKFKERRRKTKEKEVKKDEEKEVKKDEDEPMEVFVYEGKEPISTVDIVLDDDSDSDEELDWDPEKSYVGEQIDPPEKFTEGEEEEKVELDEGAELNTKRRRWIKKGAPILKREDIPKEWNWTDEEFDLDIDDIEAQIERNKERIADGVLPWQFEVRLKEYENLKLIKDQLMDRYPGKSYEVAQRLDELSALQKHFITEGDEFDQLPNVRALLLHYRTDRLYWDEGLVTYWSHGKQLCQPRPFKWDEFFRVNKKYKGYQSFWVEGYNPPGPQSRYLHMRRFPGPVNKRNLTPVTLSVKLPRDSATESFDLPMWDDTGCCMMTIRRKDITNLQTANIAAGNRAPRLPPLMGTTRVRLGDGTWAANPEPVVALHINVLNDAGAEILPEWVPIQCSLTPVPPAGTRPPPRLAGPFLRQQLYTASLPDGSKDLWAFDVRTHYNQVRPVAPSVVANRLANRPLPEPIRLDEKNKGSRNY